MTYRQRFESSTLYMQQSIFVSKVTISDNDGILVIDYDDDGGD